MRYFNFIKNIISVSLMTIISRILGLLREIVIFTSFGPSLHLDAFIIAFRIPNFLRRIFAEGSFSQSFVPILTDYKENRSFRSVQILVNQVATVLSIVLLFITIIGVISAPFLLLAFTPGYINEPDKQALSIRLLEITFPYILFISLTAFASSVLNTYKQFTVPAITPVFLNISLILCAVYLAPNMEEPIIALAIGVFIAGIIQLLFQIPFLLRLKLLPKPSFKGDLLGLKRVINLMVPALFASSIVQINLLIDTILASFLPAGSISWLYISERLVEFPQGVFGVALAIVVLPNLSEQYSNHDAKSFSNILDWSFKLIFLIALPAALGLALLATPVLSTLFQYQRFSTNDVYMASHSLMAYLIGLPAFILIKVLSAGFFSRQDSKTPVKIAVIAVLSNIVLNLLFIYPLQHVGLALATSLAAFIQVALLYRMLKKQGVYEPSQGWLKYSGQIILALLVMLLVLVSLSTDTNQWYEWGVWERVKQLSILIGLGAASYLLSLYLFGVRFSNMLSSKPS